MEREFEKDYEKETGEKIVPQMGMFGIIGYMVYLENRLKDVEEKVKQLIIYAKTL